MGLIDFVKGAGKALGIGKGSDEEKEQAGKKAYDDAKARYEEARLGAALEKSVRAHNLEVKDLDIKVSGDTARVYGSVGAQSDREKIVVAVGNHEGIGKVDDRLSVEEVKAQATYYTVKSGDTLSQIAKHHYGDASKYPVIFEANKPMLSHPDKIYPGQNLRIPPLED